MANYAALRARVMALPIYYRAELMEAIAKAEEYDTARIVDRVTDKILTAAEKMSQGEKAEHNQMCGRIFKHLQAYKATGLTPEQVEQLKGAIAVYAGESAVAVDVTKICRLLDLAKAEKEGRLIVQEEKQ